MQNSGVYAVKFDDKQLMPKIIKIGKKTFIKWSDKYYSKSGSK